MAAKSVTIREFHPEDLAGVEAVRAMAFAPAFDSFRRLLGDEIYEIAQAPEDRAQGGLLAEIAVTESPWRLFVAERGGAIVGFVSAMLNAERSVGEIGLNAVHPDHRGEGIASALYEHALGYMRDAGMRVATVGAGADESHTAALAAYRKAGFTVGVPSIWLCRLL